MNLGTDMHTVWVFQEFPVVTLFLCLILLQFAVIATHDLIDIPGWNHGSQVKALFGAGKTWAATMINSIFPGVAAGFALYFWHRPWPVYVPRYWVIYCGVAVLTAFLMWYVPYWMGANEKTRREYAAMYAGTRHLLPARGDNPRPNAFHIGLHVLFVSTFCLSLLLWLRH